MNEPSYQGEMYCERLDGDRCVVMLDPDSTIRPRAGRHYMAVLVEVDGDGPPRGRRVWPSQRAAGLCADPAFVEYVRERTLGLASPKTWILANCGITSRSDLDRDAEAEARYRGLYATFKAWESKRSRNAQGTRSLEDEAQVPENCRSPAARIPG